MEIGVPTVFKVFGKKFVNKRNNVEYEQQLNKKTQIIVYGICYIFRYLNKIQ